jgi:hypothetical protein
MDVNHVITNYTPGDAGRNNIIIIIIIIIIKNINTLYDRTFHFDEIFFYFCFLSFKYCPPVRIF